MHWIRILQALSLCASVGTILVLMCCPRLSCASYSSSHSDNNQRWTCRMSSTYLKCIQTIPKDQKKTGKLQSWHVPLPLGPQVMREYPKNYIVLGIFTLGDACLVLQCNIISNLLYCTDYTWLLRKPAGRLGKVVFRERSEYRGCGGGPDGPRIHRRLVIRVSSMKFLQGHVPLGNFVTVGFDSPQVR